MGKESRINIHIFKKDVDYHEYLLITTELVITPIEITLASIYSLVNDVYKISTVFIKLILDVEQFGASSDLSVPT